MPGQGRKKPTSNRRNPANLVDAIAKTQVGKVFSHRGKKYLKTPDGRTMRFNRT